MAFLEGSSISSFHRCMDRGSVAVLIDTEADFEEALVY